MDMKLVNSQTKNHFCSLGKYKRCAYCELDLDASSDSFKETKNKIKKARELLEDAQEDFKYRLRNCVNFVKDDIDLEIESLKNELDKLRETLFDELDEQESNALNYLQSQNLKYCNENVMESKVQDEIELSINQVQNIFDTKFKIHFQSKRDIGLSIGIIKYQINRILPDTKWKYMSEDYDIKKFQQEFSIITEDNFYSVADIGCDRLACASDGKIEIISQNDGTVLYSFEHCKTFITSLSNDKFATIKTSDINSVRNNQILVYDSNTFEFSATQTKNIVMGLENIDDKIIASSELHFESRQYSEFIILYKIENLSLIKVGAISDSELHITRCIKGLTNDLLAVGTGNNKILIFNYRTLNRELMLQHHNGPVKDLQLLEPEDLLMSASNDHTIRLWNYRTGECVRKIDESESVLCIRFVSNPLYFVCAVGSEIKFYERQSYQCFQSISNDLLQIDGRIKELSILGNDVFLVCSCNKLQTFTFNKKKFLKETYK